MSIDDEIVKVKKDLEQIKTKRIQTKERLRTLENEKEALLRECKLLGVDPTKVEEVITEESKKIEIALKEIKTTLEQFHVTGS